MNYPVQSNQAIVLQSYHGGPAYPGTPAPLGTPWLTEFVLADGITEIDFALIPTLQALLNTPSAISRPGLVVHVGGVAYSF